MGEMLKNNRRMLVFLVTASFLLNFGFQVWQALFNNFAVEEIGVGPAGVGWIQALRELPGVLSFLLALLALYLSEVRIITLSIFLLGVGILMSGKATTVHYLLISTLVMSLGFHFHGPSSNGVILMTVDKKEAPNFLGQLGSLGSIAALLATAVVYLLAKPLGYRSLFIYVGGFIMLGSLLLLPLGKSQNGLPPRRKVILRRQYWMYYTLSFLMGSRRHIFTTFAIFLLVKVHNINVQTTAILFLINNLINTYSYQALGKLIQRLGEKLTLSIAFGSLILIFLGYAYINSLFILFGLYVLDNLVFGFNLALTTYFHKIAVTQEEITSNLSVEQTINHIAAIIVPVFGGIIWEQYGSQAPFLVGVGIVAISLILVQFLRIPKPQTPEAVALSV